VREYVFIPSGPRERFVESHCSRPSRTMNFRVYSFSSFPFLLTGKNDSRVRLRCRSVFVQCRRPNRPSLCAYTDFKRREVHANRKKPRTYCCRFTAKTNVPESENVSARSALTPACYAAFAAAWAWTRCTDGCCLFIYLFRANDRTSCSLPSCGRNVTALPNRNNERGGGGNEKEKKKTIVSFPGAPARRVTT